MSSFNTAKPFDRSSNCHTLSSFSSSPRSGFWLPLCLGARTANSLESHFWKVDRGKCCCLQKRLNDSPLSSYRSIESSTNFCRAPLPERSNSGICNEVKKISKEVKNRRAKSCRPTRACGPDWSQCYCSKQSDWWPLSSVACSSVKWCWFRFSPLKKLHFVSRKRSIYDGTVSWFAIETIVLTVLTNHSGTTTSTCRPKN